MTSFDDIPISRPCEDLFGFNEFALTVSGYIEGINRPVGTVVAIYGSWGSGKSSTINLVRHHLMKNANGIEIFEFPAWAYRTDDALSIGFFKELRAGLSPVLSRNAKAKRALRKLATEFANARGSVGVGVGAVAGPIGELFTRVTLGLLSWIIPQVETVEDLQSQLANALEGSKKRFLIVVDDLDRLSPEEALVIFRLIKSVGRLPKVMYLLAYDREAMENAVTKRFPSEGSHYLEKIVQAGLDLPEPDQLRLDDMFLGFLGDIGLEPSEFKHQEFGNLFHGIVAPELRTPRDVIRLASAISITIRLVRENVNLPDFVSLETLRVFRPSVYRAIRANKLAILNAGHSERLDQKEDLSKEYSMKLLGQESAADQLRLCDGLMRLFPQLQSVFANYVHSETDEWSRRRRVCSRRHFDTYFRYSLSPETVSKDELDYILGEKRTKDEIQDFFRSALSTFRSDGRTMASYVLDELITHGADIPVSRGQEILSALFEISDSLMVEGDVGHGYEIANNQFRLHWLLRAILTGRTSLEERSGILVEAMKNAPLLWHLDFSNHVWIVQRSDNGEGKTVQKTDVLLTEDAVQFLRQRSLELVRQSVSDQSLLDCPDPAAVLFAWSNLSTDGCDEVMAFTSDALDDDDSVVKLARAFLGKSYTRTIGFGGGEPADLVGRETDYARVDAIHLIIDTQLFRKRLTALVADDRLDEIDRDIVRRFLKAWDNHESNGN